MRDFLLASREPGKLLHAFANLLPRHTQLIELLEVQPSCLACFVAEHLRTPITCGSRNTPRSDARSATNSPSRCAAAIIARCTDPAMRSHGGVKPESTPLAPRGRCGSRRIRCPRLPRKRASASLSLIRKLAKGNSSLVHKVCRERVPWVALQRAAHTVLTASAP